MVLWGFAFGAIALFDDLLGHRISGALLRVLVGVSNAATVGGSQAHELEAYGVPPLGSIPRS